MGGDCWGRELQGMAFLSAEVEVPPNKRHFVLTASQLRVKGRPLNGWSCGRWTLCTELTSPSLMLQSLRGIENEFEKEINLDVTGSPTSLFSWFLVPRIMETSRDTVTHWRCRGKPVARMSIQGPSFSHLSIMLLAIHPPRACPRPFLLPGSYTRFWGQSIRKVGKTSIEKTYTVFMGPLESSRTLVMQNGIQLGSLVGKAGEASRRRDSSVYCWRKHD